MEPSKRTTNVDNMRRRNTDNCIAHNSIVLWAIQTGDILARNSALSGLIFDLTFTPRLEGGLHP